MVSSIGCDNAVEFSPRIYKTQHLAIRALARLRKPEDLKVVQTLANMPPDEFAAVWPEFLKLFPVTARDPKESETDISTFTRASSSSNLDPGTDVSNATFPSTSSSSTKVIRSPSSSINVVSLNSLAWIARFGDLKFNKTLGTQDPSHSQELIWLPNEGSSAGADNVLDDDTAMLALREPQEFVPIYVGGARLH